MPTYDTIDRVRWRPHRRRFTSFLFSHDIHDRILDLRDLSFRTCRVSDNLVIVRLVPARKSVARRCNHGLRGK